MPRPCFAGENGASSRSLQLLAFVEIKAINQLFLRCIRLLRAFRKEAGALKSSQPLSGSRQGRGSLGAGVAGTSPGDKPV